jgi:hypothetical protein
MDQFLDCPSSSASDEEMQANSGCYACAQAETALYSSLRAALRPRLIIPAHFSKESSVAGVPVAALPAISQLNVNPSIPVGASLCPGGATFRAWASRAHAVYVNGTFGGTMHNGADPDLQLENTSGSRAGFLPGVIDGDTYIFLVVVDANTGTKRDPYACEMAINRPFPECSCVLRSTSAYPWPDTASVIPDYSNMLVYQLNIGAYDPTSNNTKASTFLDVIKQIEYLAALSINVLHRFASGEATRESSGSRTVCHAQQFATVIPGRNIEWKFSILIP